MNTITIRVSNIPKGDVEYLARGVLASIGEYFAEPKVQEDYEKWLAERKRKEVAV
ncbi:MAG: hypothetical protein ACLUKQ_02275 [Peptococcaceae bacterium]